MPAAARFPNFPALEELIRRDPAGRGPASFLWQGRPLGVGQLEMATRSLAESARAVAIVTGFAVHDGQRYVAETDGPPGALALAEVLLEQGIEVALVSDPIGLPALAACCQAMRLSPALHEFPFEEGDESAAARQSNDAGSIQSDAWIDQFLATDFGNRLTHLVSIERVGPSHTLESFLAQSREGPPLLEEFEGEVPAEHRNVCHNMRGGPINGCTAKTHRLFEVVRERRLTITTIGIGDGGNELGMGQFPWEALCAAIARGPAGRVACRLATDFTLLAGVSNWGGYALAGAFDRMCGGDHFLRVWNAHRERELLATMIDVAHCVDGLTRRREATVDGLSTQQSAALWPELHGALR